MTIVYRSAKAELAILKGIDETDDPAKHISILRDAVEQMANFTTVETQRILTSLNGVGGNAQNLRTATTNTIFASTDGTLLYDTTSTTVDAQLPLVSAYPGMIVQVKKKAGANAATLTPSGSDTIAGGGAATITAYARYQANAVTNDWEQLI